MSKDAYYRLKKLQNYNYIIDKKIREVASFDEKQLGILKVVFHKSLTMGWWGVSELIYKRDGPWEKAYKERFNRVIEPELIKKYFLKEIISPRTFSILLPEAISFYEKENCNYASTTKE